MSLDFEQEVLHSRGRKSKRRSVRAAERVPFRPPAKLPGKRARVYVIPERLTTQICAITDRSRPYWTNVRSGLPFSTIYVESAVLLPLLTFFAVCTVPAGTNKTSPAFSVSGV